MKIETIYISTYRYDFAAAKYCVASIRYWYPSIEIRLIKDFGGGDFDTKEFQKKWNVGLFKSDRKYFGYGFGKLEPLFLNENKGFLVLDADTLLIGPILESIENMDTDFIVDDELQPLTRFEEIYYKKDKIKKLFPAFSIPGYSFNSGQWFGTSGMINREDFSEILQWTQPPKLIHKEVFFDGDQGILNYIIQKKEQENKIRVCKHKIMIWPNGSNADFIDLNVIKNKGKNYPYIIHFAGMRYDDLQNLPRKDILLFFKEYYFKSGSIVEKVQENLFIKYLAFEKKFKRKLNSYLHG